MKLPWHNMKCYTDKCLHRLRKSKDTLHRNEPSRSETWPSQMKANCTNHCIIKCGETKRSVQILAAIVCDSLTEAAISYKMLLLMCKSARPSGLKWQKSSVTDISVTNRLEKTKRTVDMRQAILITIIWMTPCIYLYLLHAVMLRSSTSCPQSICVGCVRFSQQREQCHISRLPITTVAQGQSQASPHAICGQQSATGASFSPST